MSFAFHSCFIRLAFGRSTSLRGNRRTHLLRLIIWQPYVSKKYVICIPLAFFKNSTAHGCADFAEREFAPSLSLRREFSCCEKTRRFFTTILPAAADAGIGVRTCFASSFGIHKFQNNTSFTFHLHFSKIVPRTDARILPSENSHPLFRFEENSRVVKKHDVFSQRSCLRPSRVPNRY